MRPRSVAWAKSTGDLRLPSSETSTVVVTPTDRDGTARPRGIIRIKVNYNDASTMPSSKEEPVTKDDDDADSAISGENGSEDSATLAYKPSPPVLSTRSENPTSHRRFQRRSVLPVIKRSGFNSSGSAAAKVKTAMSARVVQNGEPHKDNTNRLTSSGGGGSSTLPAWKLRKAMKNFKMSRLATAGTDGQLNADFGAPHIQYFLASLCDQASPSALDDQQHSSNSKNSNHRGSTSSIVTNSETRDDSSALGLTARCPLASEVRKLVSKLRSAQPVNAQGYQLSVAVTVLKEFLNGIPGGVFGELTSEFYQISLESSLELTIMYLHSILHEMPYVVQQFTYLLCKALRNLIRLTGGSSLKNYTDLLMHFTPVLFSSSVGDIDKFLRAARLLLVMVDDCERVFLPLPWLDSKGNWCWHNGDFEDETFFRQIFDSLQNLEARLATDDSGVDSEPEETITTAAANAESSASLTRSMSTCSLVDFYQVVYLDD